jgi:hypothetical protein
MRRRRIDVEKGWNRLLLRLTTTGQGMYVCGALGRPLEWGWLRLMLGQIGKEERDVGSSKGLVDFFITVGAGAMEHLAGSARTCYAARSEVRAWHAGTGGEGCSPVASERLAKETL